MEPPDRIAHYIRRNETVRVPRRHIFVHLAARSKATKAGTVKSWGVAVCTFRAAAKGRRAQERTEVHTDPHALWDAITAHTCEGARTVLWAHNLGFGTRLADCLQILPCMGWELLGHNLAPRGTWLIWGKGKTRLTMVDLAAVYPKLLPEIGKAFGMAIRRADPTRESMESVIDRCRDGEAIVRTAATAYLDWIESAELGNWQLTGAGQSWAAMRHKHLTHQLLVHDDRDALAMERAAMYTGRCEAYWHGTWLREVIQEWDFTACYPSICREISLPTKLIAAMPDRYPWRRHLNDPKVAFLAECTVETESPVVPTRHGGRILWPVGRFDSTLWDVEIAAAIEAGATVTVHGGYLYRKSPALKQWAEWIIGMLTPGENEAEAWQKIIAKHWSTAAIGRFGMMYPEWEPLGTSVRPAVDRRVCVDIDTGERYDIMQVGRTLFRQGEMVEWQHSMPAITGYVMAAARVKLWKLLRALPDRTALYVDTDSILVPDSAFKIMAELASTPIGAGLRLKRSWDGFGIYGPRQIITGEKVRVSGVPTSAVRIDRQTFAGEVWESLATSISSRRSNQVVTRDRVWHAKGVDRRRNGPAFGWTEPIRIGETA